LGVSISISVEDFTDREKSKTGRLEKWYHGVPRGPAKDF
jgi:hypothetical protein